MGGFDAITNHIGLIFFSVTLDLLLWLGPHLRVFSLINNLLEQMNWLSPSSGSATGLSASTFQQAQEVWKQASEHFNLLSALRSYPVGIPSLMAGRAPIQAPLSEPALLDIPSLGAALGIWVGLGVVGLVAGTLYFALVAQASLEGRVEWRRALVNWPWATLHVLLLAALWLGLALLVSLPFSCLLTILLLMGVGATGLLLLVYGGLLAWIIVPLIFSPHGIFVYRFPVWTSVRRSLRVTRFTLPSLGMFLLTAIILSEGLDLLWQVPAENSWWTLVGVAGHAFVTTGLLAASFVYYRDADSWVERLLQQAQLASIRKTR